MSSTANSYHCDYLDHHELPPPFTSERAELAHVDEQIISLERHISQLTALRHALLGRSCDLRNLLAPIRKLPVEILSYIFEQLIDVTDSHGASRNLYRACLRQAFTLVSVSSYFRRIAFGTPELWRRIPLDIVNRDVIDNASLLRYCSALTPSLDLAVMAGEDLDDDEARSCVDALLTPDITRQVKNFDLHDKYSFGLWIEKLKDSGPPMLNTLSISTRWTSILSFDIRVFSTMNRLKLTSRIIDTAILVPPSLQYLTVNNVPVENVEPLLRQCPNLIECHISWYDELDYDIEFIKPLTLPHLKSLSVSGEYLIVSSPSVEKLHLPSLKILKLDLFERGAIPLCRSVAATLTSLRIYVDLDNFYDSLYQLRSTSLPKLEELDITLWEDDCHLHLDPVLKQLEDDHHHKPQLHYPILRSIIIRILNPITFSSLLTWLRKSELGREFFYDINFKYRQLKPDDWSPDLREELRSIVGSRQMKITWGGCNIYESCVRDGSV